jgi:nucleoid DNA-binding protein
MTKSDLVAKVAKDAEITRKAAGMVVEALVKAVHDALSGPEGAIRINDLGTFKVSKRSARTGVNPRTGEKIQIAETTVPTFTASKALKDAVKD